MVMAASMVRVVWASISASLLVSVTFTLVILGVVRSGEMHAAKRNGAAAAYTTLAICAFVCFSAGVIYGIVLLTQKS